MNNVIPPVEQPLRVLNTLPTSNAPVDVEMFDPPMCCPSGLCGPSLDQTLLDVSEMVMSLQRENLRVERYQMTSHPNTFLGNPEVMKLVREKQMESLPIIVVRGKLIKVGAYPTADEVHAALNGTTK